jgi:isocitrate dehydrogenase
MLPNSPVATTSFKLEKNPVIMSREMEEEVIVGVDMFVESFEQPTAVAEKCLNRMSDLFKLVTISNRGTQVWPKGSIFTNLVNQYRCRFESVGEQPISQTDVIELYRLLSQDFKICSTELLNMWGGKKAYSLAQGQ